MLKKEEVGYYKNLYQKAVESIINADWRGYENSGVKFHFFVIKVDGVRPLEDIVESFLMFSNSFTPGLTRFLKETFPEHMAIIEALEDHGLQEAEPLMRYPLDKSSQVLKEREE